MSPFPSEQLAKDSEQLEDSEKRVSGDPPPIVGAERPAREIHGIKWIIAVTAILSTTILFSLDNTIVADIQPSIIREFGEVSKLAWLGTAYALGSASMILPWSKAYGVFNVKWLYISHVVIFETGSAICGGAPSMNSLIAGRAIAGFGASGMYVGCLTYLSALTSGQERPLYMGLVGLVWGIGTILGPAIGGAFVESNATWRWAFYINLVVGGFFSPAYVFVLPSIDLMPDVSLKKRLTEQTDWLGIIFLAGTTVVFIMAITFGGSMFSWDSASEIVLWVITGVLFIVFTATQVWHPLVTEDQKLYPTEFQRQPTLLILQLLTFIAAACLLVPTYYIPLYFQFVQGSSALGAAVHLLAFVAMVVAFSMINGTFMAKLGYYIPWYIFGSALILIGSALMYTITPTTTSSSIYGYTVLIGAGVGSFLQASYSIVPLLVPPAKAPSAIGFLSVGQSLGIVTSLGIASAIFENRATASIRSLLPASVPESLLREAITGTNSVYFDTLPDDVRVRVVGAIVGALDRVYLLVIAAAAVAVVGSCLLPKNKLFAGAA